MDKIKITTKMFLVEGGCNACGMLNTCTYTLHFPDNQEAVIDDLDAFHLATTIALKHGYQQKVEPVGIGEDALFLVKGNNKVSTAEDDFKSTLILNDQRKVLPKKECTKEEVFTTANTLLEEFFQITPYEFQLID